MLQTQTAYVGAPPPHLVIVVGNHHWLAVIAALINAR